MYEIWWIINDSFYQDNFKQITILFLYSFRLQCLLLENNRSILEYNFIKMISYTKKRRRRRKQSSSSQEKFKSQLLYQIIKNHNFNYIKFDFNALKNLSPTKCILTN